MGGTGIAAGERISPLSAFTILFNMVVGAGCLTLPFAFSQAGWVLGLALLVVLSLVAWLSSMWVAETLAVASARARVEARGEGAEDEVLLPADAEDEWGPKAPYYIGSKQEVGLMAEAFLGRWGGIFAVRRLFVRGRIVQESSSSTGEEERGIEEAAQTVGCTRFAGAALVSPEDVESR